MKKGFEKVMFRPREALPETEEDSRRDSSLVREANSSLSLGRQKGYGKEEEMLLLWHCGAGGSTVNPSAEERKTTSRIANEKMTPFIVFVEIEFLLDFFFLL